MFFSDKEYIKRLITLSTPIILQQFVMASLSMVDILMIGQLGDVQISGVFIANQMTFVITFITFGITSGAAVFTAQFWGKRDVTGIQRVLLVSLGISTGTGLIFTAGALLFPKYLFLIYGAEADVAESGIAYLRILGFSFVSMSVTFTCAALLRSVEKVILPMTASMSGVILNTLLNYLLIFGWGPVPAWGVEGAACATVAARILEMTILVGMIYGRRMILIPDFGEIKNITISFLRSYFKTAAPVLGNELVWVCGVAAYNMIYSRIGTEAVAAVSIAGTIEGLAFVLFTGMSNGSAVMIGNEIGAFRRKRAHHFGAYTLQLGISGALAVGVCVIFLAPGIISLYRVSTLVQQYTSKILILMGAFLWIKVLNLNLIGGILRSGGDTRYAFIVDMLSVWCIGIPAAFVFHLPVHFVMLAVMSDEIVKCVVTLRRYMSRRWIHNVTRME